MQKTPRPKFSLYFWHNPFVKTRVPGQGEGVVQQFHFWYPWVPIAQWNTKTCWCNSISHIWSKHATGPPIQAKAPLVVGINFDSKIVKPLGKVWSILGKMFWYLIPNNNWILPPSFLGIVRFCILSLSEQSADALSFSNTGTRFNSGMVPVTFFNVKPLTHW